MGRDGLGLLGENNSMGEVAQAGGESLVVCEFQKILELPFSGAAFSRQHGAVRDLSRGMCF